MSDRTLRFCMITTFYPPYSFGGDAVFVHRLSNELARRGHHVEVMHCIDSYRSLAGGREPTRGYDDHPGVTVHGLESRFGILSPLATQQTGRPLLKAKRIREVLNRGFDVIHYHNVSLVGGPGILRYGSGVKLYTMHEYWLGCQTHVLFRNNQAVCEKRSCLTCSLAYKRPPQWWRYTGLMRSAVKHVDAFLAPSRFSREMHLRMGLAGRIIHLPYFIPAADEECGAVSDAEEQPYFLFVGRLEKLKGLHTVIPLFNRFRDARLLIAGTGNDEPNLRRLVEGMSNVRFLGHMSGPEMNRLFRDARGLIVPSICHDVSPLVIMEAFRQRTPAIVRRLGGMPEMIEDRGGGFVYETDDQLLGAMQKLLADKTLRDDVGQRGYETYHNEWTADAYMRRYFDLIGELSSASAPPRTVANRLAVVPGV